MRFAHRIIGYGPGYSHTVSVDRNLAARLFRAAGKRLARRERGRYRLYLMPGTVGIYLPRRRYPYRQVYLLVRLDNSSIGGLNGNRSDT